MCLSRLLQPTINVCLHSETTATTTTTTSPPTYPPTVHEPTVMAAAEPPSHVSTLFSSLLEQSRKLRQETDNDGLETVQLGLNELERRAKDLKKKTKDGQTDARAYVASSTNYSCGVGADCGCSSVGIIYSRRGGSIPTRPCATWTL